MADEIITRDQNSRVVGAGISNDVDQDISMLRVDPITNYLLVDVIADTTGLNTASQIASRDENSRTVCMAWNEDDEELQEILTDENGYLLCDLEIIT